EANAPLWLFGVDLALERLPAAADVKRRVVGFAKQQREIGGAFVFQGLDRGTKRQRRVSLAPAIFAGQNAANAARAHSAPIPFDVAAINPDMADGFTCFRLKQHAQ